MAATSPDYLPPDAPQFRRTLGRFATGVIVLSVRDAEGVRGMTINAFTSVSLDPALILVCLRNEGRLLPAVVAEGTPFGVSILGEGQREIAKAMARTDRHGIPQEHWFDDRDGLPLVAGAIAHLSCRTWSTTPAGDHTVLIAQVDALDTHPGAPLMFVDGVFGVPQPA